MGGGMSGGGEDTPLTSKQIGALNKSINEIEWGSSRIVSCFQTTFGFNAKLWQVAQASEPELLRIPNFGWRSLRRVKEMLAEFDLHVGMTLPPEFTDSPAPKEQSRYDNILPIASGFDQGQLKDWAVAVAAGQSSNLRFEIGGGFLSMSLSMREELRRRVARSAQNGEQFELKFDTIKFRLKFDPNTQKGEVELGF